MRSAVLLAFLGLAAFVPGVARAQAPAPITLCSGIEGGNYDYVAIQAGRQLGAAVVNHNTGGSVDNLAAVGSGACQAGIVQLDAWYLAVANDAKAQASMEVARDLYPEFAHLICNGKVSTLSDLKRGNTILIGNPGSGSAVTWEAMVGANKDYAAVSTLPLEGNRALGKVSLGTEAQCMLFVGGLRSQVMLKADAYAKTAKNAGSGLHLVPMRDPALFALHDPKGRAIYTRGEIPGGTYPAGLQVAGWVDSGAVDTVQVLSVLIANTAFIDKQPNAYDRFLEGMNKAMPEINDHVMPH